MVINTDNLVSITEANQNFSRATRIAVENGQAVIFHTNHQLKCAKHILIGDWYETYFRDAYLIIAKMQRRYGVENRLK